MGWYSNASGVPSSPTRTMYFCAAADAARVDQLGERGDRRSGPAAPNPSRASTAPSVSLAANFFSTAGLRVRGVALFLGRRRERDLMAGGAAARARARARATGSGGGANGI